MTNPDDLAFDTVARMPGAKEDALDSGYRFYGLTKRELFAAMAMEGLLSQVGGWSESNYPGTVARRSRECADALIAALNEEKK